MSSIWSISGLASPIVILSRKKNERETFPHYSITHYTCT
jgi:hypothetical protein